MFVRPLKYYVLLLPLAGNDYCKSTVEYMSCLLSSIYLLFLPYHYIQEEYQASIYWRTGEKPADITQEYNPNRPYYDLYRVDFTQFKALFLALCPWAQGVAPEPVCVKAFKVCFTIFYRKMHIYTILISWYISCSNLFDEMVTFICILHYSKGYPQSFLIVPCRHVLPCNRMF